MAHVCKTIQAFPPFLRNRGPAKSTPTTSNTSASFTLSRVEQFGQLHNVSTNDGRTDDIVSILVDRLFLFVGSTPSLSALMSAFGRLHVHISDVLPLSSDRPNHVYLAKSLGIWNMVNYRDTTISSWLEINRLRPSAYEFHELNHSSQWKLLLVSDEILLVPRHSFLRLSVGHLGRSNVGIY